MEELSIKEFCARYASKKNKDDIKGAAILTCVCAAISTGFGLYMRNYFVLVDVILMVGLALGIQLAKSRVCAVLLTIYACINTGMMALNNGELAGW